MIQRHVNLIKLLGKSSSALFLGASGLGKTKLSTAWAHEQAASLSYNLLDPSKFKRLLSNPSQLINEYKRNYTPPAFEKSTALREGFPLSIGSLGSAETTV